MEKVEMNIKTPFHIYKLPTFARMDEIAHDNMNIKNKISFHYE